MARPFPRSGPDAGAGPLPKREKYMVKLYPVAINKDEGSAWGVSFLDAPIHCLGDTLNEAMAECQEAFEAFMEDEELLPVPTDLETAVLSEFARDSLSVTLVEIDTAFFDAPAA